MKKIKLLEGWQIKPFRKGMKPCEVNLKDVLADTDEEWVYIGQARSVQEALIEKGLIAKDILEDGHSEYCNWIGETDWVYRSVFDIEKPHCKTWINFMGLDTVADIFLNGHYVGQGRSMYLNWKFSAEYLKETDNELIIYFHAHKKMLQLYNKEMLPHWKGNVRAEMMLRKGRDYGAAYGYSPIGLCGEVLLEQPDVMEFAHTDFEVDFNHDYTCATLHFTAEGRETELAEGAAVSFSICEKNGESPLKITVPVMTTQNGWCAKGSIKMDGPRLWWPKNYGEHPLYTICYSLACSRGKLDEVSKQTGLRHIQVAGDMRFRVNGVDVYLWGSCITPIHGLTNRYRHDVAMRLVKRFAASNMNALRI